MNKAFVREPDNTADYCPRCGSKGQPVRGETLKSYLTDEQRRTVRLRVPEVITLTGYDRLPTTAVTFSRRNIFKRDRFTCQYCGTQPGSEVLTLDHVVPRAQGGESRWDNCVLACVTCNKRKADRTPKQARMRLNKRPVQPTWRPLYAAHNIRIESWSKFVSEAYWNVELEK